jgi:hypothetical protein
MDNISNMMVDFMDEQDSMIDVDGAMGMLSDKIQEMRHLKNDMDALMENHARIKRRYDQIDAGEIPEIMNALSFKKITLSTGENVEILDIVKGKVEKEHKSKFHDWLLEQGYGDLIKTGIEVKFKREERSKALELGAKLNGLGYSAAFGEAVHWKTLDGFVKESLEENRELPECLEVSVIQKTKIK